MRINIRFVLFGYNGDMRGEVIRITTDQLARVVLNASSIIVEFVSFVFAFVL